MPRVIAVALVDLRFQKGFGVAGLDANQTGGSVRNFVCVGLGGCSCSGHGSSEALAEEDGEQSLGQAPLTSWHGPLFLRPVQDQEQQLQGCLVGRKMTAGPDR